MLVSELAAGEELHFNILSQNSAQLQRTVSARSAAIRSDVRFGSKAENLTKSKYCPLCTRKRTSDLEVCAMAAPAPMTTAKIAAAM
jgi:recombinational DNA repair protein RecR